jgi:hypothetical protein
MLMDTCPCNPDERSDIRMPNPTYRCAHAGYDRVYISDPGATKALPSNQS